MQWFYVVDGKQGGPVSESELAELARTGQLKPSDFVWNESMGETWALAKTVPGLFVSPIPPPLRMGQIVDATDEPGRIFFWAPANRAWDRMHAILFRPMNLVKWFVLGFSAWLGTLGEQGTGGTFNFGSEKWQGKLSEYWAEPAMLIQQALQFIEEHGPFVVTLVSVVAIVSLTLGLLFLWIRCRGKFMFLDNVIHDRIEIATPWRTFRQHANSLFLWRLVYGLICAAIAIMLVAAASFTFILPLYRGANLATMQLPITLNLAAWTVFAVVAAYIARYLEDFVIPIMYHENLLATEAWARFLALFGEHRGTFILYGLFYMLLSLLAGVCVLMLILFTFCLAGCLMMFPYVRAVVLLPMLVYFRLFSLEYLAQFGPEFRIGPRVNGP